MKIADFGLPPDSGVFDQKLADTGARVESKTGALRDRTDEKKLRRYDLLPRLPLYRFAVHMGRGAAKYAARNWEKGMPLSEFFNSAMDHMLKHAAGFDDEPHLDAALWNIACLIEGEDRIRRGMWPVEFDDLGKAFKGQKP